MSSFPKALDLDGCFSSEKAYQFRSDSLCDGSSVSAHRPLLIYVFFEPIFLLARGKHKEIAKKSGIILRQCDMCCWVVCFVPRRSPAKQPVKKRLIEGFSVSQS